MRLLLYSWNANNEQILVDNLSRLDFEVIWFHKECRHFTRDMELAAEMIPYIHQESIEGVLSFNYFPIISMICDTCKIPYYAWVYDCPHFTLYARQVMLPSNHIGIFDREMVNKLQDKGVQTVHHVPMAADTEYFMNAISKSGHSERQLFASDISFVGSLYTDEYNYYDRLLDHADKSYFEPIIRKQCFSYEKNYMEESLGSGDADMGMIRKKMEEQGLMLGEDYFADAEEVLQSTVLEKKVTVEERRILLNRIAEAFGSEYCFNLYTGSDLGEFPLLHRYHRGIVDYHKQMPLVFGGSRINLNITLRSIHSGIPLRVLDIMACGGFVLTNWQPEISEYFTDGREIATFRSVEECLDKITYYLKHDGERKEIAEAGWRKVKDRFDYVHGLMRLFELETGD